MMRLLLSGYKRIVSPILTALLRAVGVETQCKFHPTCSEYAAQAMAIHGVARGTALAAYRVLRCHPFTAGGVDPVPYTHAVVSSEPLGRNH